MYRHGRLLEAAESCRELNELTAGKGDKLDFQKITSNCDKMRAARNLKNKNCYDSCHEVSIPFNKPKIQTEVAGNFYFFGCII